MSAFFSGLLAQTSEPPLSQGFFFLKKEPEIAGKGGRGRQLGRGIIRLAQDEREPGKVID